MRIVESWEWTKEDSVKLAVYAAELVIGIYEKRYPNDDRPRKAIKAAKAYLKNPSDSAANAAYVAYAAANAATEDEILKKCHNYVIKLLKSKK